MGPRLVAEGADRSRLAPPISPLCTAGSEPGAGAGEPLGGAASAVAPERRTTLSEPSSFERVYEAHFDFVWRSLLLLGVQANAVEDAAQEVFSVVSRQLHTFQGRSSVRTWLFAILQRVAANQRRSARRKQQPLEPLGEEPMCWLPTPHARLEAAESIDRVQRFCNTLDTERRAVFVLALLEELPAAEVSDALGIPVNTVYSRVRSLREGLRRMLEEEESRG